MNLNDIQPSQLYINSQKLKDISKWFKSDDYENYGPLPIKKLNGKIILTDGHTMAFAVSIKNVSVAVKIVLPS